MYRACGVITVLCTVLEFTCGAWSGPLTAFVLTRRRGRSAVRVTLRRSYRPYRPRRGNRTFGSMGATPCVLEGAPLTTALRSILYMHIIQNKQRGWKDDRGVPEIFDRMTDRIIRSGIGYQLISCTFIHGRIFYTSGAPVTCPRSPDTSPSLSLSLSLSLAQMQYICISDSLQRSLHPMLHPSITARAVAPCAAPRLLLIADHARCDERRVEVGYR